jgi:hypothetical protein
MSVAVADPGTSEGVTVGYSDVGVPVKVGSGVKVAAGVREGRISVGVSVGISVAVSVGVSGGIVGVLS